MFSFTLSFSLTKITLVIQLNPSPPACHILDSGSQSAWQFRQSFHTANENHTDYPTESPRPQLVTSSTMDRNPHGSSDNRSTQRIPSRYAYYANSTRLSIRLSVCHNYIVWLACSVSDRNVRDSERFRN